ncbi:hypothetical protein ACP70R_000080 [Stipagrostis hirtigluma subsp. patula]
MAAQLTADSRGGGGGGGEGDALAAAVPLCLLHDLLGAAAFLASHPLHAAYLLFFARHLLSLAAFFWPLLASTALLLAVLATVGPYASRGGSPEWPGVWSLGRTCGIAVAALCAELRPDGAGGAGLVGQLCSFVLGPGDAASVLRVGEIMGELCDIGDSCFLLQEEESLFLLGGHECSKELAFELPPMECLIGAKSFLDFDETRDEIDDKVVISEDLKVHDSSSSEQCFPNETMFMREMEAEEEQENGIQEQGLVLSDMGEVSDGVEEKRLECDPVSVEIKKCDKMESMEIKKYESLEHQPTEIKKCEPMEPMETKKCEPVEAMVSKKLKPVESVGIKGREAAKPRSSVARRIKLWEAQVSGNIKPVLEDKEDSSMDLSLDNRPFKDVKKHVRFEIDDGVEKRGGHHQDQNVAPIEQSLEQDQEFKDVEECMPSDAETFSAKCNEDVQKPEGSSPAAEAEQGLQDQGCTNVQPEPKLQRQQHKIAQPEQVLQEREEYKDVSKSAVLCNERENSLKSTSIAGRVHTRTSSENLVSEGSPPPPPKEKEWKRTLACKLYEERMQLKLCRDRAVVEGSDNMDMLWEAYEVGGGGGGNGGGTKRGGGKVEESVEEGEEEDVNDDESEADSVRQLCCLQALKFSTRKMNFGGGKPSLAKISKVLKRMTVLSRVGSRRKQME